MRLRLTVLIVVALATLSVLSAYPLLGVSVGFAQASCQTFPETGKTVCGRFLQYWQSHGGLAQQGLPISDALGEVSDVDGKTYTVQYFERAVFEYHPENQPPHDVLLSLLGALRLKEKYGDIKPGTMPSGANVRHFEQTGASVGGGFLEYWLSHGGLEQQGYPISGEFQEVSELNGQSYLVQYFERAVFEYHPEDPAGSQVLLSQLGTFRYKQVEGTSKLTSPPLPVPPAIAEPTPTRAPVQPTATRPPQARPTATLAPQPPPPPGASSKGNVKITSIYYDGQEPRSEGDEYAIIRNVGTTAVNMAGWNLYAGDPGQDFYFPDFVLRAGAEVRVYTNRDVAGHFSFGRGSAVWNNDGDCGYLYDPDGTEVSSYCY